MSKTARAPSERAEDEDDAWMIHTDMFEEGPDNWSSSEREGWRLYLVEDIPYRDIYALTKYSWKTNREDVLVDIGTVSIDPNLSRDRVNEVMNSQDIEEYSEEQYEVLHSAYHDCLNSTIRNATLDKGFEVFDHTMYVEVDSWVEYLTENIESIHSDIERMRELKNSDEETYVDDGKIDRYASLEKISEEQLDNLELIEQAVEKPNEESLKYAKYCQFVGTLEFDTLEPFQIRAIELVQNGVFHNNEAVAVVQALREEDYSQKDIAEKLGKSESTISKQVSVAKNLTERARWHSANVTMDGRL